MTSTRRERLALTCIFVVALSLASGCSSTSAHHKIELGDLDVTKADVPTGWHSFKSTQTPPSLNACMGLSPGGSRQTYQGPNFADSNDHAVASDSGQAISTARAHAVQRIEEVGNYPTCLARSQEEGLRTATDVRLVGAVTPTRLHSGLQHDEVAVRLTYRAILSNGTEGTATLDRYALWNGQYAVNLTFYGFSSPFPAALQQRLLAGTRTRLRR